MKKTRGKLLAAFWAIAICVAVVCVLFETDIIQAGHMADDKKAEFLVTTLMEIITIASIPVALRLFKARKISAILTRHKEKALLKWGAIRMSMLGIPMIANLLLYYLFMQPTFAYLAIIGGISMVFIYPTISKCQYEVLADEDKDEADGNNR